MKTKHGFTLIELLVVIGVIGILASISVVILSSQRVKGIDAAIKSDIAQVRNQANIVFDTLSGTFGVVAYNASCGTIAVATPATHVFNDAVVQSQIDDAVSKSNAEAKCRAGGTTFVVAVPFASNSANAWCLDHTGVPRQITFATFTAADTDCITAGQ